MYEQVLCPKLLVSQKFILKTITVCVFLTGSLQAEWNTMCWWLSLPWWLHIFKLLKTHCSLWGLWLRPWGTTVALPLQRSTVLQICIFCQGASFDFANKVFMSTCVFHTHTSTFAVAINLPQSNKTIVNLLVITFFFRVGKHKTLTLKASWHLSHHWSYSQAVLFCWLCVFPLMNIFDCRIFCTAQVLLKSTWRTMGRSQAQRRQQEEGVPPNRSLSWWSCSWHLVPTFGVLLKVSFCSPSFLNQCAVEVVDLVSCPVCLMYQQINIWDLSEQKGYEHTHLLCEVPLGKST